MSDHAVPSQPVTETETDTNEATLAGRYRLDAVLATGGMGSVWSARDELLGRTVAVKLLHESLAADDGAVERFRREATTAASLSHPNMANVYDFVEIDGRPGIVMELVEGETLGARIARDGALPIDEAILVAAEVLDALGVAHSAGIVHRDVKPGNILLTPDGGVKVTDFGIARALGDDTLTRTGVVLATAHYASPEQVRGEPATPQSDLYSLGIVLYEMLTGSRPFEAETPVGVAISRLSIDPPAPRAKRPEIAAWLDGVVLRALAREPGRRFADAAEMRAALDGAVIPPTMEIEIDPDETVALPKAAPPPAPPKHRRRFAFTPALSNVLALLALGSLLGVALVRALAPGVVDVPRFEGMDVAAARALAEEQGLEPVVRERNDASAKGTVLDQDPRPSTRVAEGSELTLIVSTGRAPCCFVPSLRGLTLDEARARLDDARLELGGTLYAFSTGVESGTIVGSDPPEGTKLQAGTTVEVTVAVEPEDDEPGKGKGRGKDED